MPELPEVETIKNQLSKKITNKTITEIKVRDYQRNFRGNKQNLLAKITHIDRRAKQLIFTLDNGFSFVIHLKMTGQLIFHHRLPSEIKKSTHVIFTFQDHTVLFFNDWRKFGFVKVIPTKDLAEHFQKTGPEPLTLPLSKFKKILRKRPRSKIKPLLLEQSVIAGIGNIYAQEACYKAHILPTRTIASLTDLELKNLLSAIKTILNSAIKHQGTSFDTSYRTAENKPGGYEPYVKVYHRKNCPKCQSKLKIIKQNGRSTYYCEKCQK
ncbi:bifunctional DNA-formamidopyrimidine glycosylase/DNA-(apurinic or apyrimidinic site) lyase [Candidatus Woesearchaeota archaeon]|nr:bifunctional DNA-formamidopyrimidine glycosylase/DNA-(apurinic or apyrimidinic site) lyase [Candidatus Woesearchaeota archaeon]